MSGPGTLSGTRVVVFAPLGDEALRAIHWVGSRTAATLDERGAEVVALDGAAATRAGLEAALPTSGLVLCAHGSEHRVRGAEGEAAVDATNVGRLAGSWVHALACRTATELSHVAVAAGVVAWAGYDVALLVNWTPEELGGAETSFARLALTATLALASGTFDQREVRRQVAEAADEVERWCQDHEDETVVFGLRVTSEQLTQVVVASSATAHAPSKTSPAG